jgi:hypothetical protein
MKACRTDKISDAPEDVSRDLLQNPNMMFDFSDGWLYPEPRAEYPGLPSYDRITFWPAEQALAGPPLTDAMNDQPAVTSVPEFEEHDIWTEHLETDLAAPPPVNPAPSLSDEGVQPSPEPGPPEVPGRKAGRPSSMNLILEELRRRDREEVALPGATEEAAALLAWLVINHPKAPHPTEKTIANNIGAEGSDRRARHTARNPTRN